MTYVKWWMKDPVIAFHGHVDKGQEEEMHWGSVDQVYISMYGDMFEGKEACIVRMKRGLGYITHNYTGVYEK